MSTAPEDSPDLTRLRRWEDAGATWRVLARHEGSLSIALCRCDGGEEADRLISAEPDLHDHVAGRTSNDESA
jgi:hypothetical protein